MTTSRVFTEDELREEGMTTKDAVDKAIDANELKKAKRLNHRMYAEFLSMHDLYRDWVTLLLSFIYERYGIEVLYEAMKHSCTGWFKPILEKIEKEQDFRRRVQMFTMGIRGHLQPLEIEEDDERVCLTMPTCGSGGRLILEGAYGPPKNFSTIKEPHSITYGQRDFPMYCAHTPMLDILQIEWSDYPLVVCDVPENIRAGGCRFCLYKDRLAVPEKFYVRVGKEKKKG